MRDATEGLALPGAAADAARLPVVPPQLLGALMQAVHSGQSALPPPVLQRLASRLIPLQVPILTLDAHRM